MSVSVCVGLCVCVCLRFGTTRPIVTKFFVHVTYGCGLVLLWRHGDMLRFMDDYIFAHKLRLLDITATLRQ